MRGEKSSLRLSDVTREQFVVRFCNRFKKRTLAVSSRDFKKLANMVEMSFALLEGAFNKFSKLIGGTSFFEGQVMALEALKSAPSIIISKLDKSFKSLMKSLGEKDREALQKIYLELAEKKPSKRTMIARLGDSSAEVTRSRLTCFHAQFCIAAQ